MLAGAFDQLSRAGAAPPLVHGAARLATLAYQGQPLAALLDLIGPPPRHPADAAAWRLDRSIAHAVCFHPKEAALLQAEALGLAQVFRLRGGGDGPRLLVLMAAGDLMTNVPVDFLTVATDLQLTLMYLTPDPPPGPLPRHDAALVAVSETAPSVLRRLSPWFDSWPRPILNDPRRVLDLSRDTMVGRLDRLPGVAAAATVQASRGALLADGIACLPCGAYPVLLRPLLSHAGLGLVKCSSPSEVAAYLAATPGDAFFLTQYIDYRGADGWFRKYRIAFVDGAPFLCHMAASEHWMVHYLNAGMAESPAKRAAEAAAMAGFSTRFAVRHGEALTALADAVGLDYFSIDCTEALGLLLVFEVDVAAIIHFMDPPALYPYKRAPMQRCADAFAAMVARRR